MSKIQTDQITDGAVTEAKQTMSDSGGHDHSASGSSGSPVSRGNAAIITLAPGTYNDWNPVGADNADILLIVITAPGDVIITGLDASRKPKRPFITLSDAGAPGDLIFKHQDAGSLAANRFDNTISSDLTITAADWAQYIYANNNWILAQAGTAFQTGDYIWAVSRDVGRISDFWHKLQINPSRLVGRTSTSGLKDLTAAEARAILGTIEGPASATDNAIARYDGTTGKLVQNSAAELDDNGELKIKVYSQAAEPTLNADQFMALWIDTDDSNRVYLVFRRGAADQVKVELT